MSEPMFTKIDMEFIRELVLVLQDSEHRLNGIGIEHLIYCWKRLKKMEQIGITENNDTT